MDETFEKRLAAVERALTDGEHDCGALAEGAATADRVEELESEIEELTDRVAELEAATQALRGYVGNVRSVNEEVEAQAEAALSKAETAHRLATGEADRADGTATGPSGTATTSAATGDSGGVEDSGTATGNATATDPPDASHSAGGSAGATGSAGAAGTVERHGEPADGATTPTRCEHCNAPLGADRARAVDGSGESRLSELGDDDTGGSTRERVEFPSAETDGGREASDREADGGLLALIRDAV